MTRTKVLKSLFIFLGVFVLLQLNFSCNNQDSIPQVESSDQNLSKAPGFVLEDLGGNKVSSQEYAGKITLINFWATWCRYCRQEITHLNKIYGEYRDQGVEIIGVSFDARGAKDVIPFLKKVSVDYPILIGTRSMSNSFGGISGYPTTFLMDRKWQIYKKYPGLVSKEVIEMDVRKLLARE